jgi:hypothetical protein
VLYASVKQHGVQAAIKARLQHSISGVEKRCIVVNALVVEVRHAEDV